jgi:hypothetical protein
MITIRGNIKNSVLQIGPNGLTMQSRIPAIPPMLIIFYLELPAVKNAKQSSKFQEMLNNLYAASVEHCSPSLLYLDYSFVGFAGIMFVISTI